MELWGWGFHLGPPQFASDRFPLGRYALLGLGLGRSSALFSAGAWGGGLGAGLSPLSGP